MATMTNNANVTFIDGDINADGEINIKDLQACPVADVAAVLKPLIDVTVSNFQIVDGIATITLSDGSTFNSNANGPVEGTYSPDTNGDIVIPLTDGGAMTISGTVSPPDIDFASSTTTVLPSGAVRINYFDSNGDPITTSTIPADELSGGLAMGTDGCTLEGTLDDGTLVSVSLCDLISEITETVNADGSTTFTHSADGVDTSWTIFPRILIKDCDGVDATNGQEFVSKANIDAGNFSHVIPYVNSGDINCTPVAPTGKWAAQPHFTMNPNTKDVWMWDGTSWDVNVNAASKEIAINQYSTGGITTTISEADLIAQAGTGEQIIAVVSRTVTNNDCVPWKFAAYVRTSVGFDNLDETSIAVWQLETGPNHDAGQWVGAPNSKISGTKDNNDYLRYDRNGTIAPGQTVTFEAQITLNVDVLTPTTISSASAAGFTGRIDIWRDSGISF